MIARRHESIALYRRALEVNPSLDCVRDLLIRELAKSPTYAPRIDLHFIWQDEAKERLTKPAYYNLKN